MDHLLPLRYQSVFSYLMNLSRNLLIFGTKNKIQTNTTGQAIKNLSFHKIKKSFWKPTFIVIMNKETKVLVKKDIIRAKMKGLYFFI